MYKLSNLRGWKKNSHKSHLFVLISAKPF
jgi:hypothetical protein